MCVSQLWDSNMFISYLINCKADGLQVQAFLPQLSSVLLHHRDHHTAHVIVVIRVLQLQLELWVCPKGVCVKMQSVWRQPKIFTPTQLPLYAWICWIMYLFHYELCCSHQWSSCSLQQWSRGSSFLQRHWLPIGALCLQSEHQGSSCRSPLCHSSSWSPRTPSCSKKHTNYSQLQIWIHSTYSSTLWHLLSLILPQRAILNIAKYEIHKVLKGFSWPHYIFSLWPHEMFVNMSEIF